MCSNILRDADSRLPSAILTVSVGFAVVGLCWKLRMSRREYSLVRLSFTAVDDSIAVAKNISPNSTANDWRRRLSIATIALFLARSDWGLGELFYNDQL